MNAEDYRKLIVKKPHGFDGEAFIRRTLTKMQVPFEEQVKYAPDRKYRADFMLIGEERQILIEYNGGTWIKSGHSSGTGLNRDAEKLNCATANGFAYLVLTADLLKRSGYLEALIESVRCR